MLNSAGPAAVHGLPPHLLPRDAGLGPSLPQPSINEEITTIFVVGFPDDMKEREFANLFLFAHDFEGAVLKIPSSISYSQSTTLLPHANALSVAYITPSGSSGTVTPQDDDAKSEEDRDYGLANQPFGRKFSTAGMSHLFCPPDIFTGPRKQIIGFARFRTHEAAVKAIQTLDGKKIDPERCSLVMKAEIAKKNLIPKKTVAGASSTDFSAVEPSSNCDPMAPAITPFELECPNKTSSTNAELLSTVASRNMQSGKLSLPCLPLVPGQLYRNGPNGVLYPIGENPPCNTLYVGNLPMNVNEDELRRLFCNTAGYKRLSFKMKSNGPMCFVEYEDIWYATHSMNELYGTMLSCSTKGGIRLSYSKNPLGVRSQGQAGNGNGSDHADALASYVNQISLQQTHPCNQQLYPGQMLSGNVTGPSMVPASASMYPGYYGTPSSVPSPIHPTDLFSQSAPHLMAASPYTPSFDVRPNESDDSSWSQSRLAAHLQSRSEHARNVPADLQPGTEMHPHSEVASSINPASSTFLDLFLKSGSTPGLSANPTSPFHKPDTLVATGGGGGSSINFPNDSFIKMNDAAASSSSPSYIPPGRAVGQLAKNSLDPFVIGDSNDACAPKMTRASSLAFPLSHSPPPPPHPHPISQSNYFMHPIGQGGLFNSKPV